MSQEQIEVVKAEIDRQNIQRSLLRVAIGNTRTAQDYRLMTAKARGDYGITREHGRLYRAVWGLIGLLCVTADGVHKRMVRINREG